MVLCGVLAIVVLVAAVVLIRRQQPTGKLALVGSVLLFVAAVILRPDAEVSDDLDATRVAAQVPKQESTNGYVSSKACRDCHPDQHASWSRSFHRTMTQVVTPETMAAPAEEFRSNLHGRDFHFFAENDRFFVDVVDPDWDAERVKVGLTTIPENEKPPYVRRQVVMSTGSHHIQTFWMNGSKGNQLWPVPWVYHVQMKKWIPQLDSFIIPPEHYRNNTYWNENCIHCHSTGGEPRLQVPEGPDTRVGELGIACEACHGPGLKHAEYQTQLRKSGVPGSASEGEIINAARLSHRRSSEVCGQCHSANKFDGPRKLFVPGERLEDSVTLLRFDDEFVQKSPMRSSFWNDGTMRLAGRDFSALETSACYQRGEISCLSCHSMHRFESPDDQLVPAMNSDAACLKCHETFAEDISSHTHHSPDSPGSRCHNCHMPHTTYGLFKAIRSHRIDSPTSIMTIKHGRPNACVLCHVDRTISWIDGNLVDWYGHEPVTASDRDEEVSPGVMFLLTGDAVQRAVMVWNFGREETRQASGDDWQLPLLAELLDDPYSVVRAAAAQTIRKFPATDDFKYDFLAPAEKRQKARADLINAWDQHRSSSGQPAGSVSRSADRLRQLLLTPAGARDSARLKALLPLRDDRDIYFAE